MDKIFVLQILMRVERLLSEGRSDDYGRYTQLGLDIEPNDPINLSRNGKTQLSQSLKVRLECPVQIIAMHIFTLLIKFSP